MKDLSEIFKKSFYYKDGNLYKINPRYPSRKIGTITKAGYVSICVGDKRFYAHSIIFSLFNGYVPKMIDHRDRDKLNNNIENLRDATPLLNALNKGLQKNNKTGVKGVCKGNSKWVAQIKVNNRKIHLGTFNSFEEAVIIRKQAEKLYNYDI